MNLPINKLQRYLLTLWVFFSAIAVLKAQDINKEIKAYRKKQLKELSVGEVAPLKKKDLKSVHFYDVNEKLRLTAKVEILSNEQPFYMPSFVGAPQEFVRYAKLHFQINGQEYSLTAYKNLRLALLPNAESQPYFVPFKDNTNGAETYDGGRYLNIPIPQGSETVVLDFNKAYNPYCAYNDGYRCPIPPTENHLNISIPAGEKQYTGVIRSRD